MQNCAKIGKESGKEKKQKEKKAENHFGSLCVSSFVFQSQGREV